MKGINILILNVFIIKLIYNFLYREVNFEEGKALADSWGCAFVETSAKENENIGMSVIFKRL